MSSFHPMKPSYGVVSALGRVVELPIDNLQAQVLSKTHIHQFHLAALDPGRPACPYPLCIEVLDGIEDFKNHFATVHGVNL